MATPAPAARGGGGKPWYPFRSFENFFRTLGVVTALLLIVGLGFCVGASYSDFRNVQSDHSRQVRPDNREVRREEKAARPAISTVSSVPSPASAQPQEEDEAAKRLRIFRESLAKQSSDGAGEAPMPPSQPQSAPVQPPVAAETVPVNETLEQKAARLEREAVRRSAERKDKGGSQ